MVVVVVGIHTVLGATLRQGRPASEQAAYLAVLNQTILLCFFILLTLWILQTQTYSLLCYFFIYVLYTPCNGNASIYFLLAGRFLGISCKLGLF